MFELIAAAALASEPIPMFDMHLHAFKADENGPPPNPLCLPGAGSMPAPDPAKPWPQQFMSAPSLPTCSDRETVPMDDAALVEQTVAMLEANHAAGVVGGYDPQLIARFVEAAGGRLLPAIQLNAAFDDPNIDEVRALLSDGGYVMLGEVTNQYGGVAPADARMAPWWAMAEELDVPVLYHMGGGPPGTTAFFPDFRAGLADPTLLEPVLAKHPRLRIAIAHMAEGYEGQLGLMLYAYPQLYVDIGGIMWMYDRAHLDHKLKRLVDMGFANRVMVGSDQMVWPGMIGRARKFVMEADYLTDEQKRMILFDNAMRFMKLDGEEWARIALGEKDEN